MFFIVGNNQWLVEKQLLAFGRRDLVLLPAFKKVPLIPKEPFATGEKIVFTHELCIYQQYTDVKVVRSPSFF
jgi:hypothetical protein